MDHSIINGELYHTDELRHYGVPGMKWGQRTRNSIKSQKKGETFANDVMRDPKNMYILKKVQTHANDTLRREKNKKVASVAKTSAAAVGSLVVSAILLGTEPKY